MKQNILLIRSVCLVLLLLGVQIANAQFPYTQTFKNTTAPGVVFGGSATSFLTAGVVTGDTNGNGYLRLTDATNYQKGYIYGNTQFPTTYGLKASFEYFSYGGSGADGICFFLFDAAASPFSIGSFGGSLGYAQFNSPVSSGVSKGYLGVGLDEFGNFSNPNEGRQGGPGFTPNAVVLRGAGNGSAATSTNYPYLTGVQTTSLSPSFNIAVSGRAPLPSNAGYRRVDISMKPRTGGGYDITVQVTTGGTTPTTYTVINNYAYTTAAPANLKFGFAASTGGSTNYHEIRNLNIDVFDPSPLVTPTARDTAVSACYGQPLSFNILSNAVLPNLPKAADSTSVRFVTPGSGVLTNTLTLPGMGTFYADTTFGAKGIVTFTPAAGFSGAVTPVQYTFRDNYGKQATNGQLSVTVKPAITNNIISTTSTINQYSGTLPAGGNGTFTYQWQYSTTDSVNGFVNGSGTSTGQNYTAPPHSTVIWYRRIVISNGCPVYSNVLGISARGVPLPLNLLSFDAAAYYNDIILDWETANEQNVQAFIIERSDMAVDWTPIGNVAAKGSGKYSYTDEAPGTGMHYYRLKMQDMDGKYTYSPVRRVQISGDEVVRVYPNPVTENIFITLNDPLRYNKLELTDMNGRMLQSITAVAQNTMDMSSYPTGLYILTLYGKNGSKNTYQVMKR